jgi:hypothetical protein
MNTLVSIILHWQALTAQWTGSAWPGSDIQTCLGESLPFNSWSAYPPCIPIYLGQTNPFAHGGERACPVCPGFWKYRLHITSKASQLGLGFNDEMINRSLSSCMEKLTVAHVERHLWSMRGSNPLPFGLWVQRFTNLAVLLAKVIGLAIV